MEAELKENELVEKDKMKISFSEYSTYMQCPHKWYLQYFHRLPSDTSDELIFGSTVHGVIEELLTNKILQRMYKMDRDKVIKDIYKGVLKDVLSKVEDIPFLTKFKANNVGQIFMYQTEKLISELNYFERFKNYEVADVEFLLNGLKIAENDKCQVIFKGFIDLVLKNKEDDTYMILDWKTSGKAWDIAKKLKDNSDFFAQLCLYKYFYSQVKGIPFENIETKFYNLPRSEPKKQSLYNGNLRKEYVDNFISNFIDTCFKIYDHKQLEKDFTKIKMVTKQNYCFRCKFNTTEFCNDTEEFQKVIKPITP
jgi:hypothetical protein